MKKKLLLVFAILLVLFSFSTASHCSSEDQILKGMNPLLPGDRDFTIFYGGMMRKYRVHVPPSYNSNKPTPVILLFHGGGGRSYGMEKVSLMNDVADRQSFLAVYPQGSGIEISGTTLGTWNAGKCCGPAMKNQVDDVGFVAKMLDQLEKDFNIDPSRVYATGHSNGAQMSYRLACELSDRIAAIAPVGGDSFFTACPNQKEPVSILHIHGTADQCVRYTGGICGCDFFGYHPWSCDSIPGEIKAWAKKYSLPPKPRITLHRGHSTCISYGAKNSGIEVALCAVTGMGHTWPGGTYGPICENEKKYTRLCQKFMATCGAISYDLNADEIIWNFFRNHPKH